MILVDATPLQTEHRYRGIGTYVAGLFDGFTHVGWPDWLTLGLLLETGENVYPSIVREMLMGDGVRHIPLRRPRWRRSRLQWLTGPIGIASAIRSVRARLYHATDPNGLVYSRGVPTIATLFDLIPLHNVEAYLPLRRPDGRIGYAHYQNRLKRADRLIAISEATKRDAVERLRLAPDRITVIPLAVDDRRFYPQSKEKIDALLERRDLRQPYFLCIGSADPHKNTSNILRAFSIFRRESPADHTLYIAGKWPEQAVEELRLRRVGTDADARVRWLGYIPDDDLPSLYSGAEALVYPSLVEGFGLPALEAMRCGTPVLTSTTSSLPEVTGDAALLVDPSDAEAIAGALVRLADEPALKADLATRGLVRAQAFSWRRTAEATLGVYKQLLSP